MNKNISSLEDLKLSMRTIRETSLIDVLVILIMHYKLNLKISYLCKILKIYRSRYYDIFTLIEQRIGLSKLEIYEAFMMNYPIDELSHFNETQYALDLVRLLTNDDRILMKKWEILND